MTVPKVKLYTNDDRFVAEVVVLPFKTMPEVLIWGSRVFKLHGVNAYREVFAYSVPITAPEDATQS